MLSDITLTNQALTAARAAGDDAEARRLEEVMRPLWVTLYELRAKDPTDPHTRAAAQGEVIGVLGTLVRRKHEARSAGDEAEVRRLEEVMRPLRVRSNEIREMVLRRHAASAAHDSDEAWRLVQEGKAQWDRLVAFWRAAPFDPHTI